MIVRRTKIRCFPLCTKVNVPGNREPKLSSHFLERYEADFMEVKGCDKKLQRKVGG